MMDAYSRDPMGDEKPLSDYARQNLIPGLINHPTTIVLLALEAETPCGIATCFLGFSTFAAKPLINISDFYIEPQLRGHGIGYKLLNAVEDEARRIGCCKLTLEVQQNNAIARAIYSKFGFAQAAIRGGCSWWWFDVHGEAAGLAKCRRTMRSIETLRRWFFEMVRPFGGGSLTLVFQWHRISPRAKYRSQQIRTGNPTRPVPQALRPRVGTSP